MWKRKLRNKIKELRKDLSLLGASKDKGISLLGASKDKGVSNFRQ